MTAFKRKAYQSLVLGGRGQEARSRLERGWGVPDFPGLVPKERGHGGVLYHDAMEQAPTPNPDKQTQTKMLPFRKLGVGTVIINYPGSMWSMNIVNNKQVRFSHLI